MTLESSEVKNFSWRISTILKSFLVSSSSCHAALPLFIRPMLRIHNMVLKIIFFISRIQSLHHLLEVDYHDEEDWSVSSTLKSRERIFWSFNISPSSFPDRYSFCGWAGRGASLWFYFGLWSARKSKCIRLQRKLFEQNFRGFLLVVVVLLVVQIRDQLIQAMRNSDPRVRIVFVHRLNSDFHSIFTL